MSRAVLFDTETTGLEPQLGHRVIEVAALELLNDLPTGRRFHALIHPEREIPEDATRIHGFTLADLAGRPRFGEIVDEVPKMMGGVTGRRGPWTVGHLLDQLHVRALQ